MMYCTAAFGCERATALLSQMERAEDQLETQGIYHVRGGIDRYLKTFPEGGYWKGRNYLFDLRGEQKAEEKADDVVDDETNRHCGDSYCCVCKDHYALYKGKHVCSNKECKVPVIVCDGCRARAETELKSTLLCQLCERGHVLRDLPLPDLVGQKESWRSRETLASPPRDDRSGKKSPSVTWNPHGGFTSRDSRSSSPRPSSIGARRRDAGKRAPRRGVSTAGGGGRVEWIPDKNTGFFYGSCYVEFPSTEDAERAPKRAMDAPPKLGKRNARG